MEYYTIGDSIKDILLYKSVICYTSLGEALLVLRIHMIKGKEGVELLN